MAFKKLLAFTFSLLLASAVWLPMSSSSAAVWEAASPPGSFLQLIDVNYDYNPATGTVTITYQYKNISGSVISNPRVVNLFLWSNDICSVPWDAMGYGGSGGFSNSDQSATAINPDGFFDWNGLVTNPAPPMDSTGVFPTLPVQSTQAGVSYPYFNVCTSTAGTWEDQEVATLSTSWNVSNPYWVQSESLVVSCQGVDCPPFPDFDDDSDGVTCADTCPATPNGAGGGVCASLLSGLVVATGTPCASDGDCPAFCALNQEPEACLCHSDITGDTKVDLADLVEMKGEFLVGCPPSPCSADITGDGKVDLSDLVIIKAEFLRTNCTP